MRNGALRFVMEDELRIIRHEEQLDSFDTAMTIAVEKAMTALGQYYARRQKFLWLDSQSPKDLIRTDQALSDLRQAKLEMQYALLDINRRIETKF